MSISRLSVALVLTLTGLVAPAATALANHDHFVLTPNGKCHQVASGQTAISPGHGGYHRFHFKVHVGATESTPPAPPTDNLGDGHAAAAVYRDACP